MDEDDVGGCGGSQSPLFFLEDDLFEVKLPPLPVLVPELVRDPTVFLI
jgi:hypothetical protein